jgi:hypothetical protein
VLWETIIFGGLLDQYHKRHTGRADGLKGHTAALKACQGPCFQKSNSTRQASIAGSVPPAARSERH